MLWFDRKERKRKMEFIQNYVPTSKAQLLQVAMYFCKGDTAKAQEMFDFYAKNLSLPDFDPIQPTLMQQVKTGATGLYSFLKDNQGDIAQAYQFVYSLIKNKGAMPLAEAEQALPPINE